MTSQPEHQEPAGGDWLADCVGYAVEAPAGRIGRVADVERDGDSGRPVALVVRAGFAGMRRLVVPVDQIAGVVPSSGRIVLDGSSRGPLEPKTAPRPATAAA